jgi:4-hydroxymandelate oxidase
MADVSELERQARELLRPEVYDYYAGGSGGEVTLRANAEAWRRVRFLPRVLRDVSAVRTGVRLGPPLNLDLRTPLAVAPTAFHRLAHPEGEAATAAGAARAGALFVLSTRSSRRIEDVAAAVACAAGSWWFQVYMMRERELTAGLVRRAAAAGARALVLTGDTPVVGRQALVPGGGVISDSDFEDNLGRLDDRSRARFVPASLADIGWLGEISGGLPVLVKGVLRADDAAACLAAGAAGVIVSNHGGRQLDPVAASFDVLPSIVDAVAGRCPVIVDGGIRSGGDVLACLAAGASAAFLGRPVLHGLAADGAEGVGEVLRIVRDELADAMSLAGLRSLADVGPWLTGRTGDSGH